MRIDSTHVTTVNNTEEQMAQSDMSAGGTANDFGGRSTSTSTGGAGATDSAGMMDRARDLAGSTSDKLADVGSTVREKTGNAKDSLADAIDSGADKLESHVGHGDAQLAGANGASATVAADGKVAQVTDKVATGMHATADWIRDADLDSLKSAVERQAKEHPGRTLLIAAGVGYLVGKAMRK
jgi:hypothetical protein